jgi:hypothetical protein
MSDDLNAVLEAQQWLLETSLPLVFEAFDDAVKRRVEEPVVVLLDCEDAIGGEIARSWLGEETVEDAILHQSDDVDADSEATTVFAVAFSLEECRTEVPAVFPYLEPALQGPPDAGFYAISVTSGGASILIVPPDARP